MYFETGQGSALSANAHHGVDQQTLEARAYAVARRFKPLLVNTVVGFIGPEYLFDGKQITRAGLEDHFCGKLMGVPMGVDVCYTNHAEADQDDMDALLALLVAAGVNFVMGVPGADDIMLGYQSTSFHDALAMRDLFGRSPAPEFEAWLAAAGPDGCRRAASGRATCRAASARCCRPEHDMTDDDRRSSAAATTTLGRPAAADRGAHRAAAHRRVAGDRAAARLPAGPCPRPRRGARAARRSAARRRTRRARRSGARGRERRRRIAQHYLMRPDLGRRLAPDAEATLAPHAGRLRCRVRHRRRPVGARRADACAAGARRRAADAARRRLADRAARRRPPRPRRDRRRDRGAARRRLAWRC